MTGPVDDGHPYDLVAIGAGPAGEAATAVASFAGRRAIVVERNEPGGTVTTTGGVPTKTLREAAVSFLGFRDRDARGLRFDTPPEVVLDGIRRRTWDVSASLQRLTAESIAARGVGYLPGTARLGPGRTVHVTLDDGSERRLEARHVLIATGSRPDRPAALRLDHPGVCDTDTILGRGRPPKDLLVVGGGPVAIEFATIACALGAHVTMVDRGDRLLAMMDTELVERLAAVLADGGVRIVHGATVDSVSPRGERLDARLSTGETLDVDTVLVAAGRAANVEGLGLEAAGVKLDDRNRILVDACFRTTAPGIYAAGDVLRPTLASVATEQGRAVACHAFGIPVEGTVDPTPVSAVYGMPEIAAAGLTEEACRARGLDWQVGRAELALTPRGAIAGRGGLLKLIFAVRDRRLLGVHCLGDIASEIVGIGQMAIRCGATLDTIANMSMATPTYSYAYKYAAYDGIRRAVGRTV